MLLPIRSSFFYSRSRFSLDCKSSFGSQKCTILNGLGGSVMISITSSILSVLKPFLVKAASRSFFRFYFLSSYIRLFCVLKLLFRTWTPSSTSQSPKSSSPSSSIWLSSASLISWEVRMKFEFSISYSILLLLLSSSVWNLTICSSILSITSRQVSSASELLAEPLADPIFWILS